MLLTGYVKVWTVMNNQKDDQAFEEYMKGGSSLSGRYKSESTEEPPEQLNARILAAAKKAVDSKTPGAGSPGYRWYVPFTLAAVVVISFSIVFRIHDRESLPAGNKYPGTKTEQ